MVTDFSAYAFSCIGASHIKNDTVCQDYALCVRKEDYCLAVVCDGHGGEDYFRSDKGSRFAAEAFCSCVQNTEFLSRLKEADIFSNAMDVVIKQLIKSVIVRWNTSVEQDMQENPFSEPELEKLSEKTRLRYESGKRLVSAYGTTLVGFVFAGNHCFGIQIGDGKCVAVNNQGQFFDPIPWDENCFLNVTTSICDENAFSEFRYWYSGSLFSSYPEAVFLCSDGVEDSFAGITKLKDFYRLILKNLSSSDSDDAVNDLKDYLPQLSKEGSGDDMSLALLVNRNFIRDNTRLWEGFGVRLLIEHNGNLDAERPRERYYKETILEAVPGSYEMSDFTCGSHRTGFFEILSAEDSLVKIEIDGAEYEITREASLKLAQSEDQASYDGPHFTAEDVLCFTLL